MRIRDFFISLSLLVMAASCNPFQAEMEYYKQAVASIDADLSSVQESIDTFYDIISLLQQNDFIRDVFPIMETSRITGYSMFFSNGEIIDLYFGNDGEKGEPGNDGMDGADGYVPVIKLMKDKDGRSYWSVNGIFLVDSYNNKISAEGNNGASPALRLVNKVWMISFDKGTTWKPLGSSVLVSVSIFKYAEISEGKEVVIYLQDGEVFTIPVYKSMKLSLEQAEVFDKGVSQSLRYQVNGKGNNGVESEVSYSITKGWLAEIIRNSDSDGILKITPQEPQGLKADLILFYSSEGKTVSVYQSLSVNESSLSASKE